MATVKAVPVRSHRFTPTREYTLGVEEELMLVDASSYALAPGVETVLAASPGTGIRTELMQCQVEIATEPHSTVDDVLDDLVGLRAQVIRVAAIAGMRVVAAGTHPFSLAEEQAITKRDRYREILAALRYPLRRELCCGMHVHVAVGSGNKAMRLIEAMLPDLPLLIALSASSPFWRGQPSGLHSTRTIVFGSLPRTGLPPPFRDYDEYADAIEHLEKAHAIGDHSQIWWDVRPHPRFGTVEVRVMDVQPRVADSAAIAGLVQALVRHYGVRYERGELYANANRFLVAENRWLAARHGRHAPIVAADSEQTMSARVAIEQLCDRVADDAVAVGAGSAIEHVRGMLEQWSSADRQLALERKGATLEQVVQVLADETAQRP